MCYPTLILSLYCSFSSAPLTTQYLLTGFHLTLCLGISDGSHVPIRSILALNVRTEIAYGMFDDGCTVISWKAKNTNYLGQNWDWQQEQKENLIDLRIRQSGKPMIEMISEAGIIGKIGLNSAGVGVCLNAIRAKGVDFGKLPCHLALRACLESSSREEAVNVLQKAGVASAGHITIADPSGGIGLECSHADIVALPMPPNGILTHTNHFIKQHPGVEEKLEWQDSLLRLTRIGKLMENIDPSLDKLSFFLKDEDGLPTAICRDQTHDSTVATLFSIRMDLKKRIAEVIVGRPTKPEEHLRFSLEPNQGNGIA